MDHAPGRAQHCADADEDIRRRVDAVGDTASRLDDLVGAYLHGSLATGSFYRPESDVDLLVLTETGLAVETKRRMPLDLLAQFDERPIVGGAELSVVQGQAVEAFRHPPYELQQCSATFLGRPCSTPCSTTCA